jgi:hypothetical protein
VQVLDKIPLKKWKKNLVQISKLIFEKTFESLKILKQAFLVESQVDFLRKKYFLKWLQKFGKITTFLSTTSLNRQHSRTRSCIIKPFVIILLHITINDNQFR